MTQAATGFWNGWRNPSHRREVATAKPSIIPFLKILKIIPFLKLIFDNKVWMSWKQALKLAMPQQKQNNLPQLHSVIEFFEYVPGQPFQKGISLLSSPTWLLPEHFCPWEVLWQRGHLRKKEWKHFEKACYYYYHNPWFLGYLANKIFPPPIRFAKKVIILYARVSN